MTTWLSIWLGKKCPLGCVSDMTAVREMMGEGDRHIVVADQPIGDLAVTPIETVIQGVMGGPFADDWMRYTECVVEPAWRFTKGHAWSDWLRIYFAATEDDLWYLDSDARLKYMPDVKTGTAYFAPIGKDRLHLAILYSGGRVPFFEGLIRKVSNGEPVTRKSLYCILNRQEVAGEIAALPADCFTHVGNNE